MNRRSVMARPRRRVKDLEVDQALKDVYGHLPATVETEKQKRVRIRSEVLKMKDEGLI